MQIEGRVGVQTLQDGAQQPPRLGHAGEIVVDDAHGHFYEANYRAGLFIASTPTAGVAPGTAFGTGQGAFALYNPPGNTKNACVKKASFTFLSGLMITALGDASEPLPAVVGTAMNGIPGLSSVPPSW